MLNEQERTQLLEHVRSYPEPRAGLTYVLQYLQQRAGYLSDAAVAEAANTAAEEFGIEVVDVRLKRISLPAQVRESVFNRMRAERARMARRYRAEGDEACEPIRLSRPDHGDTCR